MTVIIENIVNRSIQLKMPSTDTSTDSSSKSGIYLPPAVSSSLLSFPSPEDFPILGSRI